MKIEDKSEDDEVDIVEAYCMESNGEDEITQEWINSITKETTTEQKSSKNKTLIETFNEQPEEIRKSEKDNIETLTKENNQAEVDHAEIICERTDEEIGNLKARLIKLWTKQRAKRKMMFEILQLKFTINNLKHRGKRRKEAMKG
jgi:hypothetical protein